MDDKMEYNTNKPYAVLFCYSAKTIKKTETVNNVKEWGASNGVTSITTEKTIDVHIGQDMMIKVDGIDTFILQYPKDEKSWFGLGYADEVIENAGYKGNGISIYEEGDMLVMYIALGKKEGTIEYV